MNKTKRLLSLLLALALVLSMGVSLIGCGEDDGDATGDAASQSTYSVTVKTAGGMAMEGIEVYVYADSSLADMKQYGQTDADGKLSFALPQSDSYAITLSGVPKGYAVEEVYSFSGTSAAITLTSGLITDGSLADVQLGLGDVMYDFTVTAASGEQIKLSEMLAGKDMVLLNFWFSTCGPCANEFPFMEEAYQLYKDSVGIIALDPLETNETVSGYQASMGLTFPMAACPATWSATFSISGYPTSVVIDRYGVICLIEVGGLTSLRPFSCMFDYFTGDDYVQKLCAGGVSDVITTMKPTYEMPDPDEIASVLGTTDLPISYYLTADASSAEYAWPFIVTEKNGSACLKASNSGIEGSYAMLCAEVELKAGQALGFDYLISSESGMDILYVIVDDEDIFQISGVDEKESWKSCYPWVAEEDGTYKLVLCYMKDDSTNSGDDTAYIKNLRIASVSDIDTATYLPRQAATTKDDFTYTYATIVYNESDGYYHVGTKTGPLLLANLMGYTHFNEEKSINTMASDGDISYSDGTYYDAILPYLQYASNSSLSGYCTVTKELAALLQVADEQVGFDDEDDQEWLKLCQYYQVYGTTVQLEDPIAGLATFSAFEAKLGVGVASNKFVYDGRTIMPRGLLAKFVPTKSGVYRITSHNDSSDGVEAWLFDENHNELMTYEADERMFTEDGEVSIVYYMQAGKPYFIDIAFWDIYGEGTITYDIEYVAAEYDHFRLASPAYFTYDTDATGEAMYHTIAGGIDVVLGSDGYYYHDLGGGKKGSKLYCDFTGITGVFDTPIATTNGIRGMIDKGAFDFSKTELDLYVLGYLNKNNGDEAAAIAELKEVWGEEYDAYYAEYQVEDVLAGRYHGTGKDLTAEITTYLNSIIKSGSKEAQGCVLVTERLAEILQLLMDKYTFENIDNSWTKLCYYYDHLGPNS